MPQRAAFLGLVVGLFGIAGCPVQSDLNLSSDVVPSAAVGVDEVAPAAPTVAGSVSAAFEARLAADFPDCEIPAQLDAWRDEILRLVNSERAAAGVGEVVRDQTLERQATQYACEMLQGDFFAHVNPLTQSTLSERADEFGYLYLVVGENLAAGQQSPEEAFNDWMNSPGHRRNILDPRFTELGVGIRAGGRYGLYWVQEFGLPVDQNP